MKLLSLVILFSLSSCGNSLKEGCNQMPIDHIIGLTQDGLPAYLVLTGKDSIGSNLTILLTNLELHWLAYSEFELEVGFLDSLKCILKTGQIPVQMKIEQLRELAVDQILLNNLRPLTSTEIYTDFFDEKGIPLESKNSKEVEAAVSILIQRGVVVQQGKYSMFNIYVRP